MWITIGIILGLLLLWAVGDILYDIHTFQVTTYRFKSAKIRQPFRFVVLSDLHNKEFGKNNNRLLEQIRKLSPDAVLIAGDLLTAKAGESVEPAANLVEALAQEYPVYYGLGNHEQRLERSQKLVKMKEEYWKRLDAADVHPLSDEDRLLIEHGVRIYGLSLDKKYYQRFHNVPMHESYLAEKLGMADKNHYVILLAHNPDYFKDYCKWGADLVLSGHNHGGIICLPFLGGVISPKCTLFPKYDAGRFEENETTMLLSRGLGTHTLPIRLLNHAQLLYVELLPEK